MSATPVFDFRDSYPAESYWGRTFLAGAESVLERLGWLIRPLTHLDYQAADSVLGQLWDTGLDESDTFPFGLLWILRSTGAIGDVPGLDAQLVDWRRWEETDHFGESLGFLPPLATPSDTKEEPDALV